LNQLFFFFIPLINTCTQADDKFDSDVT
jgi:hypothetical protein